MVFGETPVCDATDGGFDELLAARFGRVVRRPACQRVCATLEL
jgi:hypothetical protein